MDISNSANLESEGLSAYVSAIESSTDIIKRDLVASYYNVGYSYVQSGMDTAQVFELLVDALTTTSVVVQYSTLKLISMKVQEGDGFSFDSYIDTLGKEGEIAALEYLLEGETQESEDGESDRVLLAKYTLYSSINSSLDSLEESIIDEKDGTSSSTDTRTTPVGADVESEDYLPLNSDGTLNYGIYTGYAGYELGDCGAYSDDAVEGTTKSTRRLAYASFISSLKANFLVGDDEDARDVLAISYINEEYLSQLQQQVINEYYERYEEEQEKLIDSVDSDGVYTFLAERYQRDFDDQSVANSSHDDFESSMSSLSDTSFILYAPATDGTDGGTYGYIYNILLPFSEAQNVNIDNTNTTAAYYYSRKAILDDIVATDQRSAWFNGAEDYSFDASQSDIDYYGKAEGRNYLFFENNLTDTERYADLEKYDGRYSYNGSVSENEDGSYSLIPAKLTVDDVLSELDSNRQNYLLNRIGNIQTIVTCTGLDEFVNNRFEINRVFHVSQGQISD